MRPKAHQKARISLIQRLQIAAPRMAFAAAAAAGLLAISPLSAQQGGGMQPGEAFVTRFSGVTQVPGPNNQPLLVINPAGTSGSIIDVRAPGAAPNGLEWLTEPQRNAVTAAQVGQVFGAVLDDASPPNIYLSATAAFGLHTAPGTTNWMSGMWGAGGGPGTIYKLDAGNNYQPRVFANVALGNRANTGAALGNLTYDRVNKQLFVTDMETGMITRIRASDGAVLGTFDHGTQARVNFFNVSNGQNMALPPIAFDPKTAARRDACPGGSFDRSPECWNLAAPGRRVWGVGVRNDQTQNETRLFYAVWSGPGYGDQSWAKMSEDDKRNSIWSVRLAADGSFDLTSVRRELIMPDFFMRTQDIARAGYSSPVSDITFSACSARPIMLVAERGGMKNLGLQSDEPFANAHEARALRYELDQSGIWQPIGRYDVGFYDRKNEGQPYMHANCAGGIAFGLGYSADFTGVDPAKPDQFVWITGNALCSPEGPCPMAQDGGQLQADGNPTEVHGIQGLPESAIDQLISDAMIGTYPATGDVYPSVGAAQSVMIDTDILIDQNGAPITPEFSRNDATKIGDIAVYEICTAPAMVSYLPPPQPVPPGTIIAGHDPVATHALVASHGVDYSHYRVASHNPYVSHDIVISNGGIQPHDPILSQIHFPAGSTPQHTLVQSIYIPPPHDPVLSNLHLPIGSTPQHTLVQSVIVGPHDPIISISHLPAGSTPQHTIIQSIYLPPPHNVIVSIGHLPAGSTPAHTVAQSIVVGPHNVIVSIGHLPAGSTPQHSLAQSVLLPPPHSTIVSIAHVPAGSTPTHTLAQSVLLPPPHSTIVSIAHVPAGSTPTHTVAQSVLLPPPHATIVSIAHFPAGSTPTHTVAQSIIVTPPAHNTIVSIAHLPAGSTPTHSLAQSIIVTPTPTPTPHNTLASLAHVPAGSTPTHSLAQSVIVPPAHTTLISAAHLPAGSTPTHSLAQSIIVTPTPTPTPHNTLVSLAHVPTGSTVTHSVAQSVLITPTPSPGQHTPAISAVHIPVGSTAMHSLAQSTLVISPTPTPTPTPTHTPAQSSAGTPPPHDTIISIAQPHNTIVSIGQVHSTAQSVAATPLHTTAQSVAATPLHTTAQSIVVTPTHTTAQSVVVTPLHTTAQSIVMTSPTQTQTHSVAQSAGITTPPTPPTLPTHTAIQSAAIVQQQHVPAGSVVQTHMPVGSTPIQQHVPVGSIQVQQHVPVGSVQVQQHVPVGSVQVQQHSPPGSIVVQQHSPPGSVQVHVPAGSSPPPQMHLPPGSGRH